MGVGGGGQGECGGDVGGEIGEDGGEGGVWHDGHCQEDE